MAMSMRVLLLLCASCTLASASIKDELNFLNKDVPLTRTQRDVLSNADQLIPIDYKEIADRFENTVDACNDAYSIVCPKNTTTETVPLNLKAIKNNILEILKSPIHEYDIESLRIEKNLFHKCMELGNEDYDTKQRTLADFEYIIHQIYDHIAVHSSWQSLDMLLGKLGFGHVFYDIKVEQDPENRGRNIITVQPPSNVRVNRITELIMKIFRTSNDYANDEGWTIWTFFNAMKRSNYQIELFFFSLHEILSHAGEKIPLAHRYVERTTLNSWQKNNDLYSWNATQMNWSRIISSEFDSANLNVDINGEELLLIKNKQYFLSLNDLLNSTSNNVISSVILTITLAEQLPYVDWESFYDLEHKAKEEFCFKETKLYGASFTELQRFKDKNINGIWSKTSINTLNNIISVISSDISGSHTLSANQKRYLEYELRSMTANILQLEDYLQAVADYYENYESYQIYFTDILNYRKMIRNKELRTLRDESLIFRPESLLYSIIDLHKPRNRFLTKLLTINMEVTVPMHRSIFYSKYAPDVAQYLYSLLNENRFVDYKRDFLGTESELDTYPIFVSSVVDCYWSSMRQVENQNVKFIKHMLTTMFGLHIAYEAMLNDYAIIGATPENIPISEINWISIDEMFFISYLRNHCSLGTNVLNQLFSISDYILPAMCDNPVNEAAGCKQQLFGIQSKAIFVS